MERQRRERGTHAGISNEIGDRDEGAVVSVDESLVPRVLVNVLDLYDMGKGKGSISLGDVFDLCRVVVVLSIKSLFCSGNSSFHVQTRSRVGDFSRVGERRTKGDDLVVLQGQVADSVGDRNIVLQSQ